MKIENVPPSFVYFLSGIGAAAAVNLLTAIPTSDLNRFQSVILVGFSFFWFGASLMLAWTAAAIEDGHQEFAQLPTARLNEVEVADLRKEVFAGFRRKIIGRIIGAVFFVIGGAVAVVVVDLRDYGSESSETCISSHGECPSVTEAQIPDLAGASRQEAQQSIESFVESETESINSKSGIRGTSLPIASEHLESSSKEGVSNRDLSENTDGQTKKIN